MNMEHRVYPYDLADMLKKYVVGRRLVGADGDTLLLDDGVRLTLVGSSDCCAWGDATVMDVVQSENVITAVTSEEEGEGLGRANIFLLTNSGPVARINQDWNESNGYYFYGVYLTVTGMEEENLIRDITDTIIGATRASKED